MKIKKLPHPRSVLFTDPGVLYPDDSAARGGSENHRCDSVLSAVLLSDYDSYRYTTTAAHRLVKGEQEYG